MQLQQQSYKDLYPEYYSLQRHQSLAEIASTILDASVDCKNKDHGSSFGFSSNANKINANKALVTLSYGACLRCMFHYGSLTFAQLLTCVMT